MAEYKTKQKSDVVSYLEKNAGKHITASKIALDMNNEGIHIGMATIYRTLEKLVDEGMVKKYFIGENDGACFEYIDKKNSCKHPNCFHLKCEKCGKLIHLDCHEMSHLITHINSDHGFIIDPMRTIFYGICQSCQQKANWRNI
ncbi:MAG: transcriptional repressor [Clostridia bacterium]|nr:transcriptional repressor [Clostridia bacterium]